MAADCGRPPNSLKSVAPSDTWGNLHAAGARMYRAPNGLLLGGPRGREPNLFHLATPRLRTRLPLHSNLDPPQIRCSSPTRKRLAAGLRMP